MRDSWKLSMETAQIVFYAASMTTKAASVLKLIGWPLLVLAITQTPSTYGFGTKRAGERITAVPITAVSRVDFDESLSDTIRSLSNLTPPVLSLGSVATLQAQPEFSGFSDGDIGGYVNGVRNLTIRGISAISRENVDSAGAVISLFQNNRLNLAYGSTTGCAIEIRQDASSRVGDESVNFYWHPKPVVGKTEYHLFEPDGYMYASLLADVGVAVRLGSYQGPPPTYDQAEAQWAQANQANELTISTARLGRLNDTVTMLGGIIDNLSIPSGVGGFSSYVGRSLLRQDGWTDTQKQDAARELRGYIYGCMLPEAQLDFDHRSLYKLSLDLYLNFKLSSSPSYNEHIKRAGNWHFDLMRDSGEFRWISVTGGGGMINDPTGSPTFSGKNSFWQTAARLDGTKVEQEFVIPGVDYLSSAFRWDNKLIVGGISMANQTTTFYGYLDQDNDGRVEDGTRRTLFSANMFDGGFDIRWNNSVGELGLLDLKTRGLYRATGSDTDGFPTGFSDWGTLGDARKDLLKLRFSIDGKWATGFPDIGTTLTPYYHTTEALYDMTNGKFKDLRVSYRYDEVKLKPAVAETPWAGSLDLRATYTPNSVLNAYKYDKPSTTWLMAGSGFSDPFGRAMIRFDSALAAGDLIRLGSDPEDISPNYCVPVSSINPRLFDIDLYRMDNAKLSYFGQPETEMDLEFTTDFNQWNVLQSAFTTMFGIATHKLQQLPNQGFFRVQAKPKQTLLVTDYLPVAFGVPFYFHPGWNDRYGLGTTFDFATPYPAEVVAFATATGVAQLLLHTSGPSSFSYRVFQNAVFIQAGQLILYPELRKLFFPPVTLDGQLAGVEIRCLVIGGENYPMYQFNLGHPDACPDTHWHKPPPNRVYHLNNDTTGLADPNFSGCGFGSFFEIPQTTVFVPVLGYQLFAINHPPTLPF